MTNYEIKGGKSKGGINVRATLNTVELISYFKTIGETVSIADVKVVRKFN